MNHSLLTLRNIRHKYRSGFSLNVKQFEVEEGRHVCILGPNGSGKTTLLKIAAFLEIPRHGEVLFRGRPLQGEAGLRAFHRQTAYVPQDVVLYRTTVEENIGIGLKLHGMPRREVQAKADAAMEALGIRHLRGRGRAGISGGEARRIALARALVVQPRILFMDEPFSGLDQVVREELLGDIREGVRGISCTLVFVTHDHEEALRVAERVAVLMRGELRQTGSATDVLSFPNDVEVADFVGMRNIIPAVVESCADGLLELALENGGKLLAAGSMPQGSRVFACIPPESVVLYTPGGGLATSARNVLEGVVETVTPARYGCWVRLRCAIPLQVCVTSQALVSLGAGVGSRLCALVKATAVHVVTR